MSDQPPPMRRTRKPKPATEQAAPSTPAPAPPPASDAPLPWEGEPPADFKAARRKRAQLEDPGKGKDRYPPHSIDAEQGVLGCILLSPADCLSTCIEQLKTSEVFYDLRHRTIYEVLFEMYDKSTPVDLISVQQTLKDKQQLEAIGGLGYLASLPDCVPSAANLDYYLAIVLEKYSLRRMIGTCTEVVSRAYEHRGEVDELLEQVQHDITTIVDESVYKSSVETPKTLVPSTLHHIEYLKLNAGNITGVTSGLVDLDTITWGLQPAEFIILAARPSVGKTALALNIADHVAVELKLPVAFFSLEMNKQSLMMRLLCSRSGVSATNIRKGWINADAETKLSQAGLALAKAPLYIDDRSGLSIMQVRAVTRRLVQKYGIKLLVVDYLQLMTATVRANDNRQQEVSNISAGLKGIAKEHNIPVLALSQLSRKMDDRGLNARPKLSDLRESGSLEQDADVVILLSRYKDSDFEEQEVQTICADVAKNRNGPTDRVNLIFIKGCTRFESAAKISGDDIPDDEPKLFQP